MCVADEGGITLPGGASLGVAYIIGLLGKNKPYTVTATSLWDQNVETRSYSLDNTQELSATYQSGYYLAGFPRVGSHFVGIPRDNFSVVIISRDSRELPLLPAR